VPYEIRGQKFNKWFSVANGYEWICQSAVILVLQLMLLLLQLCQPEGQHPLTGQRAANFRLLANQ